MLNTLIENKIDEIITKIAKHYQVSRLQIKVEMMASRVIIKHYDGDHWNILNEYPNYDLFLRQWN
jgi:hypothetical protein